MLMGQEGSLGRTSLRYLRRLIWRRLQVSIMERMAAILGPAASLPTCKASSGFPHNAHQHANLPLIKAPFHFQPRFPSKSNPIAPLLCNGPSLNLHKTRLSGSPPLPKPTLKIKQAHSLATAKLHTRQSALLIQPDNSRLLLRAEAPTWPPHHPILVFHARDYLKSGAQRIVGFAYVCLRGYRTTA